MLSEGHQEVRAFRSGTHLELKLARRTAVLARGDVGCGWDVVPARPQGPGTRLEAVPQHLRRQSCQHVDTCAKCAKCAKCAHACMLACGVPRSLVSARAVVTPPRASGRGVEELPGSLGAWAPMPDAAMSHWCASENGGRGSREDQRAARTLSRWYHAHAPPACVMQGAGRVAFVGTHLVGCSADACLEHRKVAPVGPQVVLHHGQHLPRSTVKDVDGHAVRCAGKAK